MALPNIKVEGLETTVNLKLDNTAKIKTLKDSLGLKTVHEGCGGSLGMEMFCKECGEKFPPKALQNAEGQTVVRRKVEGGVFKVQGTASAIDVVEEDFVIIESNYFAEAKDNPNDTAALVYALRSTGKALIGYLRLRSDSDERPAVLWSPEPGVLLLSTLFYEQERSKVIPLFEGGPVPNRKYVGAFDKLRDVGVNLPRREVEEVREAMQTAVHRK